jgi:hypothetical protein
MLNAPCKNITKTSRPIPVHLPDKSTMSNTHEGCINVPQLLPEACKAYLFHDMQSSLVSIGQLCDAGCITTFDKDTVNIRKDGAVILQGTRDPTTGLWTVDLQAQPAQPHLVQHVAMSVIAAETIGERIAFLHACVGSPAIATFRKAIDAGYFTTWPELTAAKRVDQYLSAPAATIKKGHLDQQRKKLRSTKPKAKPKCPNRTNSQAYQKPRRNNSPAHPRRTMQPCLPNLLHRHHRTYLLRPTRAVPHQLHLWHVIHDGRPLLR